MVTHTCNSSYSVSRNLEASPGKKFARPHLNQYKLGMVMPIFITTTWEVQTGGPWYRLAQALSARPDLKNN
jgi:hypothetical protein